MRALKYPDPFPDQGDDEKNIEAQLRSTLHQDLARMLQTRRPLLTHLNADTTWLLSLPIPEHALSAKNKKQKREIESEMDVGDAGTVPSTAEETARAKQYFHILIDPWLKGSQSDVAQFFSQQWHAHESAVQTIAEVEEVIGGIEDLVSSPLPSSYPPATSQPKAAIDAVVVSHEFTDHMHKETLLEVPSSVPVFAASKAADIIRSWKHFEVVVTQPTGLTSKNSDRRVTPVEPLPPWLRISRLGQDKVDLLYYHSAVMIAFCGAGEDENYEAEEVEAVIYTPHGITPEDLKPVATAEPPIRTLALLHGLHDVRIGPQLNLGAHNGLKVQRLTKAKYWVGTHDEVKRGGGIVSWFLKRHVYTVKDAIEQEVQEIGQDVDDSMTDVHFAELGNGESLLLE
jgi:hypothetical protein